MLISTHVLVGTALGRALARRAPTPLLLATAAAVGVASHFVCDVIPHWGMTGGGDVRGRVFLQVAIPDGVVGLGLLATAIAQEPAARRLVVAATALGACLPDADKVGEFALGRSPFPRRLDDWHKAIQRESLDRLPADVAIAAVGAVLLLARRTRE